MEAQVNAMNTAARKIRVLIMDNTKTFREILTSGLVQDRQIEVASTSVCPAEAGHKIAVFQPDVIICDGQKLLKNDWGFIREIDGEYSVPFIIVSPPDPSVFQGFRGGVYFVAKPTNYSPQNVDRFFREIVTKIKIVVRLKAMFPQEKRHFRETAAKNLRPRGIIAIGASTGGTEAIFSIIKSLPENIPGVVIVQHIPPVFSKMFADRLNQESVLEVKEAEDGDFIEAGRVLVAPGDRHMQIKKVGGRYQVRLFNGEKVNGCLPSIDVLFQSVAKEAGKEAIGIILTGMGNDGARGLLAIRNKGGRTIGQDETSSAVYGMPKAAWSIGAVERQVPLKDIPKVLLHFIRQLNSY